MSYNEAVKIMGSPGEESASSPTPDAVVRIYSWKNGDGSNMSATFENGLLVSKAQAGLPQPSPPKLRLVPQHGHKPRRTPLRRSAIVAQAVCPCGQLLAFCQTGGLNR
ncbi:hypothetical protein [Sphingomonas profundi]|uniref:hypothetical protein n=1 Tax=Alterirhizorhabdus profundi TaxID=2681549 RepID=UPI0012E81133|nr:hypothetical protein [Sphingomonas profundi]